MTTAPEMLAALVDLMRRCDPEYCASHSVVQCSDDEWDDTLAEAEEVLEDIEQQCTVRGPDHDWEAKSGWIGDANVVNGTQSFPYWVCRKCKTEVMEQPEGWEPVEREYERE